MPPIKKEIEKYSAHGEDIKKETVIEKSQITSAKPGEISGKTAMEGCFRNIEHGCEFFRPEICQRDLASLSDF